MTDDDLSFTPVTESEPAKTKWARGPMMVALGIPLLFVVLAFAFLGFAYLKMQETPATEVPSVDAKDAQIARLMAEVNSLKAQKAPAADETAPVDAPLSLAPAAPVYANDPALLSRLSARVDRLEANQRLLIQAAAAATAATGLQQAAKGSQPFLSELADVEKSLSDTSLIAPLRPLAEKGVPSEVSLAIEFPAYASRAQTAAKGKTDDNSLLSRIGNALSGLILIRRVDPATARGSEAVLLTAQARLDEGDLAGAVAHLSTLPAAAQTALKPWLDKANQRLMVDNITRRITVDSLSRLSQANYATSYGAEGSL